MTPYGSQEYLRGSNRFTWYGEHNEHAKEYYEIGIITHIYPTTITITAKTISDFHQIGSG